MLTLNVNVGEVVQVGDTPSEGVVIKVKARSGRSVRLAFATHLPISVLTDGIIPARFTNGITGIRRRILDDMAPVRAYG